VTLGCQGKRVLPGLFKATAVHLAQCGKHRLAVFTSPTAAWTVQPIMHYCVGCTFDCAAANGILCSTILSISHPWPILPKIASRLVHLLDRTFGRQGIQAVHDGLHLPIPQLIQAFFHPAFCRWASLSKRHRRYCPQPLAGMSPIHDLHRLWKVGLRNPFNPFCPVVDSSQALTTIQPSAQPLAVLMQRYGVCVPQPSLITMPAQDNLRRLPLAARTFMVHGWLIHLFDRYGREGRELHLFPAFATNEHHRPISRDIGLALDWVPFRHTTSGWTFPTLRRGIGALSLIIPQRFYLLPPVLCDTANTVPQNGSPYSLRIDFCYQVK
jgi:hypothetical protein